MDRRDYQTVAHEHAVSEMLAGRSVLVVAPTGSGKSLILADILRDERLVRDGRGPILTVPTVEIGLSVYSKMDHGKLWNGMSGVSEDMQFRALASAGIWTVKRLHNALLSGDMPPPPYLLHDEGHHSVDDTHETIHALCGHCPRAAVTATPYRGTPEETQRLKAAWGEPWVALKLREAVRRAYVSRPDFRVWPLVNDDEITIRDGEFVLSQVEGAVEQAVPEIIKRVGVELYDDVARLWRRPTTIRCPGVASAKAVTQALLDAHLPAVVVTGETPRHERDAAFTYALERRAALVQVRVVGEGIDLPLRVMIDLAPTVSPLLWMQAVGRITRPVRPGEDPPVYIATNHNITRHAYLWEGLIPPAQVRDAQKAWGKEWKPTRRHMARALGLEGFGKFTVSAVPLLDGSAASLYALQTKDGLHLYAVLLHPSLPEPWYFEKTNTATGEIGTVERGGRTIEYMKKKYGPWRRIASIPNAEGYLSVKAGPVTPDMLDWWQRAAEGRGLDPGHVPDWRQFQALPILVNTRARFSFTEGE